MGILSLSFEACEANGLYTVTQMALNTVSCRKQDWDAIYGIPRCPPDKHDALMSYWTLTLGAFQPGGQI